jgi:hypothetical protein
MCAPRLAPLQRGTPLADLVRLTSHLGRSGLVGVWLAGAAKPVILSLRGPGGRRALLSADLGLLMRRCSQVAVEAGGGPVILRLACARGAAALRILEPRLLCRAPHRAARLDLS